MFLARKTVNIVIAEQTLQQEALAHLPSDLNLRARKGIVDQAVTVIVGIDDRRRNIPISLIGLRRQ